MKFWAVCKLETLIESVQSGGPVDSALVGACAGIVAREKAMLAERGRRTEAFFAARNAPDVADETARALLSGKLDAPQKGTGATSEPWWQTVARQSRERAEARRAAKRAKRQAGKDQGNG